jgi:hypothetical protein
MTPREVFEGLYAFAEARPLPILLVAVLVPLLGIGMAWVGRGGRTDEDGRVIADVMVLVGVVQFVLAMTVAYVGAAFLERRLFDTDVMLLAAPWVWLALTVVGVRQVFPLSELASWRSLRAVIAFFAVAAVFLWLLSKFRGWGIFFLGSLAELAVLLVLGGLLIRQLYQRAFRRTA